jgi:hypothetical protein
MHASIFRFDLGPCAAPRERWRCGRSLAQSLNAVEGFVAFIALESETGAAAGLCICIDATTLDQAQRVANAWQREWSEAALSAMQPLFSGEVIVQRGF